LKEVVSGIEEKLVNPTSSVKWVYTHPFFLTPSRIVFEKIIAFNPPPDFIILKVFIRVAVFKNVSVD